MRGWGILGVVAMLAACQPGGAAAPSAVASASNAAQAASAKFIALAQGSATSGQPPRATDPTAGPLLDAVFNTSALPATPPPFSELEPVNKWLLAVVKTGQVYVLAGTGVSDVANATGPGVGAKADQNVVTYAPEVGRYLDAQTAIMGVESAMIAQFAAANPDAVKDPVRADGMAKTQVGVTQALGSELSVLTDAAPSNDWKEARAKALVAVAPQAALILPPTDWQALQAAANQAAAQTTDPALAAQFKDFAAKIQPAH
jgi:hypothetical protein